MITVKHAILITHARASSTFCFKTPHFPHTLIQALAILHLLQPLETKSHLRNTHTRSLNTYGIKIKR